MLAMARSVCHGCSDLQHELGSRRPLQHAGGGPGIYDLHQVLLVLMHGVENDAPGARESALDLSGAQIHTHMHCSEFDVSHQ